jgi:tetratricopeptide (TPR) repeat protein
LAPDEVEVLRARGVLLAEQQRYDEAGADLRKAVELEPDDALNQVALAALLAQQQKYDEALPHLDKAIALEPSSAQLYNQRARVRLLKGDAAKALEDLDKTLELVPDQPMALLLRANALHQLGDRDRAMADVERVLKEQRDFTPALRMRSMLLADSGKLKEAVDTLREATQAAPEDAELRLQLATMELASKDPEAAIKDFSALIEADHDNWMALQGRADSYLALGKHKEALADYEAAIKLQPKSSTILNNLAWLLATSTFDEVRDGKRAIELATEACKVTDYKAAHILSTLAAAYAETGDFETAKEWSRKAVEAGDQRQKPQLAKELKSYEEGKPWRELIAQPLVGSDESPAESEQKTAQQDQAEKTAARVEDKEDKH